MNEPYQRSTILAAKPAIYIINQLLLMPVGLSVVMYVSHMSTSSSVGPSVSPRTMQFNASAMSSKLKEIILKQGCENIGSTVPVVPRKVHNCREVMINCH